MPEALKYVAHLMLPTYSRASASKRRNAERLRLNTFTTDMPCTYSTVVPSNVSPDARMAAWHAAPSGVARARPIRMNAATMG